MTQFVPLPLIDDFLINYNVGQALLLLFVLSVLAAIPLGSRKVLSLNAITFGVLFVVTPASLAPLHYKFLGIALLVAAPLLYSTARR
jgi:NADH:ubiquinone oxidoreductase subunit H